MIHRARRTVARGFRIVATLWCLTGLAHAANGAAAATIAYMNLIDASLVGGVEGAGGAIVRDDVGVASEILERLVRASVVHPDVATVMHDAIGAGDGATVRASVLLVWLLDVATGTEPFEQVLLRMGIPDRLSTDFDLVLRRADAARFELLDVIRASIPGVVVPRPPTRQVDERMVRDAIAVILVGTADLVTLDVRYADPATTSRRTRLR